MPNQVLIRLKLLPLWGKILVGLLVISLGWFGIRKTHNMVHL